MVELLRGKGVFERRRKSDEVRALGITLVHLGLSYRQTEKVLEPFDEISHEAVRKWSHRTRISSDGQFESLATRGGHRRDEDQARGETAVPLGGDRRRFIGDPGRSYHPIQEFVGHTDLHENRTGNLPEQTEGLCRRGHGTHGPSIDWSQMGTQYLRRKKSDRAVVLNIQTPDQALLRTRSNPSHETALSWCQSFVALYDLRRCLSWRPPAVQ